MFDLNFSSGGELSRDLLLDDPNVKPPCCPHYPEGNNKWAFTGQQPSAASNMANQQYGGRQAGVAPGRQPQRQIPAAEIKLASSNAFAFFRNADRMNR